MQTPAMSKHLEYKYKKYTSYPRASKACASKVRVGNGFDGQVLACGIVLRCRMSWNDMSRKRSCYCPLWPVRSSILQGDVQRVVLTGARCTGLLRRHCAAVY